MQQKAISFIAVLLFLCSILGGFQVQDADAGIFSRSVAKVAARKAAERKAVKKAAQKKAAQSAEYKKVLARDAARDRKTVARPLEKSRNVHRYTSNKNARTAQANGIPVRSHMTARTPKGRPISAETARKRYGLGEKPEARMTIQIPKAHPVKKNKVIGGEPGWGEITSPRRLPPQSIRRVDKIQ